MARHGHKTNPNVTSFTRTGKLNMLNRKPFRTAAQKAEARRTAEKGKDGVWRSTAPVSYHRSAQRQVAA